MPADNIQYNTGLIIQNYFAAGAAPAAAAAATAGAVGALGAIDEGQDRGSCGCSGRSCRAGCGGCGSCSGGRASITCWSCSACLPAPAPVQALLLALTLASPLTLGPARPSYWAQKTARCQEEAQQEDAAVAEEKAATAAELQKLCEELELLKQQQQQQQQQQPQQHQQQTAGGGKVGAPTASGSDAAILRWQAQTALAPVSEAGHTVSQLGDNVGSLEIYEDAEDRLFDSDDILDQTYALLQIFRKHLGLIAPQDMTSPNMNFLPVDHGPNEYDWQSKEDVTVADPLSLAFRSLWNTTARTNTEVFRKVFHVIPDDAVQDWQQYDAFFDEYFSSAKANAEAKGDGQDKPSVARVSHVCIEGFSLGEQGLKEVKEELAKVRGTLVEMPLLFLKNVEDLAHEGLAFNALTEVVYT